MTVTGWPATSTFGRDDFTCGIHDESVSSGRCRACDAYEGPCPACGPQSTVHALVEAAGPGLPRTFGVCGRCHVRWRKCMATIDGGPCRHVYAHVPGRGQLNPFCLEHEPWSIDREQARRHHLEAMVVPKLYVWWTDTPVDRLMATLQECRALGNVSLADTIKLLEKELLYRRYFECMNCGMWRDGTDAWISCQDILGASCKEITR